MFRMNVLLKEKTLFYKKRFWELMVFQRFITPKQGAKLLAKNSESFFCGLIQVFFVSSKIRKEMKFHALVKKILSNI